MESSGYRSQLESWFGHLPLEVDDLFLLERFQLLDLRERAPPVALASTLAAEPRLHRFIATRCPELAGWLADLVSSGGHDDGQRVEHERALVWELADLLVYQRFPEAYDELTELHWNPAQLADICELDGIDIVDAGAGTGWLSEQLARSARTVYAVEPVSRLRDFIRERAANAGLSNVYTLDGFLHRIPLPPSSVDVLVTSRAIGWAIALELAEVERVVRPGGWAIHCTGTASASPSALDEALESHGYTPSRYRDGGGSKRSYAKRID